RRHRPPRGARRRAPDPPAPAPGRTGAHPARGRERRTARPPRGTRRRAGQLVRLTPRRSTAWTPECSVTAEPSVTPVGMTGCSGGKWAVGDDVGSESGERVSGG